MFNYGNPIGSSALGKELCVEPKYEEIFKQMKEEMEIIEKFKRSLMQFVNVIGYHRFDDPKNGINFAAHLLGSIEFDLIGRERRMAEIERKMTQ